MTAKLIHASDLNKLATAVNAARAAGGIPNGGLLFWKGQYFQLVVDGTSSVTYSIIARQNDTTFAADAQTVTAGGAFALGTPLQVDGYFIQAFGDMAGAGGGGGGGADGNIWTTDDALGAMLPTIDASVANGFAVGIVEINATGQANAGIFVVDDTTPILQMTASATSGVNLSGVTGTGSLSLSAASTQLNGPSVTNIALNSTTLRLSGASSTLIDVVAGSLQPFTTNTVSLGASGKVWTAVWATNGTIQTSDATYKTEPLPITDAVLDAIGDVDLVSFKMLDAVALKGDAARTHFGVIAQQVVDAFAAHGLDATDYGVVCYESWDAEPAVVDSEGVEIVPGREAGSMWAVRYDELLVLEAARVRRQLALLSSN